MRKDVTKMLFVGLEKDRKSFFAKAQRIGLIEFIGTSRTFAAERQGEIQELTAALKILRSLSPLEQLMPEESSHAGPIASSIIKTKAAIEKLIEKKRLIKAEITRIKPFGYFTLPHIPRLCFQFFVSKVSQRPALENLEGLFLISSDENFDYWFSLSFAKREIGDIHELFFEKNLTSLEEALKEVNEEIRLREQDLRMAAQYSKFLHQALEDRLNQALLEAAELSAEKSLEDKIFASQGWVPHHKAKEIKELCAGYNVVIDEIEIEKADTVPTYLENRGNAEIGQDLVSIYDTPSTNDKDPSLWVFWSFVIFFAMIINDAGYGTLFLLSMLFLRYKMPPVKPFAVRFMRLGIYISTACIIWGCLTTSFFGIEFAEDNPLHKIAITDWLVEKKAAYHLEMKDAAYTDLIKEHPDLIAASSPKMLLSYKETKKGIDLYPVREQFYGTTCFELSLFIGVIHLGLSMLRNVKRNWASAGWLLFMVGAYLYFPVYLHATSMVNTVLGISPESAGRHGFEMLAVGGGSAFLLAMMQRRFAGLLEVMTLVQIFCDVLSYLRLYALGLAGMMMAATFNEMAANAGLFFGFFILLLGHTVNMTMGIMGGVIHGLRLNFLEWYHYSFEGGGRLFHPLKIYK